MLKSIITSAVAGLAAGAAGTTALNAVTYADMAWRGRPSSSAPSELVEKMAERAGTSIPGEGEARENRDSGLGALAGIVTGLGVGAAYGAARALGFRPPAVAGALVTAAAAMAGSDGPLAGFGLTDPREWGAPDWASDAIPHLAYGLVTAATYAAIRPGR
jgi:hypothetical protein